VTGRVLTGFTGHFSSDIDQLCHIVSRRVTEATLVVLWLSFKPNSWMDKIKDLYSNVLVNEGPEMVDKVVQYTRRKPSLVTHTSS
jgi:hypothetical protein